MEKEFKLSERIEEIMLGEDSIRVKYIKEFIKRRIERIKLIIKMYPHKHGEELAGELIEDLTKDAGDELVEDGN